MCVLQHMSLIIYMLLHLCISIILVAAPPARPSVRVCVGLFQTPRFAGEGRAHFIRDEGGRWSVLFREVELINNKQTNKQPNKQKSRKKS